jgi:hypothetical protein
MEENSTPSFMVGSGNWYRGGYLSVRGTWSHVIVGELMINTSKNEAMLILSTLSPGENTFKDLPYPDTTKAVCGKPVSAKIKKTEDRFVEFKVAYLEEKMLEK